MSERPTGPGPGTRTNFSGTDVPADAPPGGVQPLPNDTVAGSTGNTTSGANAPSGTGYARAVSAPSGIEPQVLAQSSVDKNDPVFGRFFAPGTDEGLDLARLKQSVVRVYDHDGDGFPEFGDIRMPDGGTAIHVQLPEELTATPNATAPAVPILNPAVCADTGMVVERHELINGRLAQLNSPGIAYGEKSRGQGTQDVGLSNPNAGATARDMSSSDKLHDRLTNIEAKVFGTGTMPAQPSGASASGFADAINAQADAASPQAKESQADASTTQPDAAPFSTPDAGTVGGTVVTPL